VHLRRMVRDIRAAGAKLVEVGFNEIVSGAAEKDDER